MTTESEKPKNNQPDGEARLWMRVDSFVPADAFEFVVAILHAHGARSRIEGPMERLWHDGRDEFRVTYERLDAGVRPTEKPASEATK